MKRRDEVLVGITSTVALIALVIGSLWLARGGLQPGYPLFAKFTWGAGLKQGQPVLLSGVNVGYIESVDIRGDGLLIVKFRIRKEYKVPLGTTATIEPNGFFGDQLMALKPTQPNPKAYLPNDTLLSGRPTPQIGDVLARADTIMGHISVLAGALRKELIEANGFVDLRKAVHEANALMSELSTIASTQNAELSRTQASLRRVMNAVDSAQVDSTMKAFRGAAVSAQALATDLRTTSDKLNAAIGKLDSGGGSAARLMNDPALYNDVRSLVTRLDSLTADFKANPKKYVKLSIF